VAAKSHGEYLTEIALCAERGAGIGVAEPGGLGHDPLISNADRDLVEDFEAARHDRGGPPPGDRSVCAALPANLLVHRERHGTLHA
jgi:hypothetical protein